MNELYRNFDIFAKGNAKTSYLWEYLYLNMEIKGNKEGELFLEKLKDKLYQNFENIVKIKKDDPFFGTMRLKKQRLKEANSFVECLSLILDLRKTYLSHYFENIIEFICDSRRDRPVDNLNKMFGAKNKHLYRAYQDFIIISAIKTDVFSIREAKEIVEKTKERKIVSDKTFEILYNVTSIRSFFNFQYRMNIDDDKRTELLDEFIDTYELSSKIAEKIFDNFY